MAVLPENSYGRVVKILMRLPDGNISAARLSVLYKELIRQHDLRLSQRLEITVHCLCLDDFARHDNGRGIHGVHILRMLRQTESTSTNDRL